MSTVIALQNVFGSTEMINVSSTFYDDPEEKHKKKSIGFPFPHVEVKLLIVHPLKFKFNSEFIFI